MRRQSIATKIIAAVNETGEYISLFRLTIDLGIDYSHAHAVTKRLNNQGLLLVTKTKKRGYPLRLQICPKGEIQTDPAPGDRRQAAN